jgi:chemotaxis protein MotB
MALNRRTGQRFQASIWPGFVDAMTGLLLVLMFVLTIFTVIQFVLMETISGQEDDLSELSGEVAALAQALGLERQTNATLSNQVGELTSTLDDAEAQVAAQSAMIAVLQREAATQSAALDDANARITAFEDRVAALLAERDTGLATISELETTRDELLSEQQALTLALASARDEIDVKLEEARLAAAREEALQALVADLQSEAQDTSASLAAALASLNEEKTRAEDLSIQLQQALAEFEVSQSELAEAAAALTAEEQARLAEAAAAEALRKRLEEAQTELTAMTLALEAKRKEAEDTLTLLAAANAAEDEVNQKLATALLTNAELELNLTKTQGELETLRQTEADRGTKLSEIEAALVQALLELDQGAETRDQVAQDLDTARADLTAARNRERTLTRQLAALHVQIDKKDAELADLEAAFEAEQLARTEAETALTEAGVARSALSDELAAARSAADLAQGEATRLQADLTAREAEVVQLGADLDTAQGQIETAQQTAEDLRRELAEALTRQAGITDERDSLETRLAAALAARLAAQDQLATKADLEEQLAAALQAKLAAETEAEEAGKTLQEREQTLEELRTKLATALVDQQTARDEAEVSLTERERVQLLLTQAQSELSEVEAREAEAQRQVTLLNEQVATLRTQLGTLQAIIDASAAEDAAAQVRIQTLGSDLNAALARAAAEARKAEAEAKKAEDELRLRLGLEDEVERLLQAEKERLARENQALERYRSDFFGQLREVIEGREGVEIVGDRFVFSSEVLFPSGSADLSEEGRVAIANVATLLLDIQNQIPAEIDWIIRVDGHTDNIRVLPGGEFTDNWDLSQARALSVVRDLVGRGLDPKRLSANGFGQFQPLNPANTAEARAQNRRIELKLTER